MHTYSWHGSVIGIELHIESHRCVGEWIICIFLCPQYKINLFHLLVQLGSFEQSNDAINEHQSTSTYYRFHFATIQKFGVFRKIRCDRTQRTNNTPVQCQLTMRTHSKNINIFGFIERDVSVHWNYPCADVKHSWWGSQRIPSTNTRTLAHTRCLSHWDSWALDVFSYEDKLVKRWVWNECAHALGAKCCEYRVDVEGALEHPKYLHLFFFCVCDTFRFYFQYSNCFQMYTLCPGSRRILFCVSLCCSMYISNELSIVLICLQLLAIIYSRYLLVNKLR